MKNLLLLPFIIIGLAANATNYYISSSGNDNNNGTSTSTPWKTIAKINNRTFSAGDVIMFQRGGVWRETLYPPSSGSTGNPIVFSAYGTGAKPIINGADIYTGNWVATGTPAIWSMNSPLTNGLTPTLKIDGIICPRVFSLGAIINNTFYIDRTPNPDKIYIYSSANPNSRVVEISTRQNAIYVGTKSNITISNLNLMNCLYSGLRLDGRGIYDGNLGKYFNGYCTIDGVDASNSVFYGIVTGNGYSYATIKNCTAYSNGNGFYADGNGDHTLFQNNIAHDNYRQFGDPFSDGDGFGVYKSSFNIIENCISYNNKTGFGIEIDLDHTDSDIIIRYNETYGNGSIFEGYGIATGNLLGSASSNLVYNNLSYLNGNDPNDNMGRELFHHNGNISFFNNTVYAKGNSTAYGITLNDNGAVTVKNNLIYSHGGTNRKCIRRQNTIVLTASNNLYYSTDATSFLSGSTFYNFSNWKGLGYDANSAYTDPLFTTNGSDFRLQAGSPAINKGVSVGLTRDIVGNPIIGLPDIGAYEHANTNTNATPTGNAGNNIILTLPTNSSTLTGSGTDTDGTIASYVWSRVSGPANFTLGTANAATTTLSNLVQGTYTFRLTVTDNDGATDTDDMTVTVNAAPVVNQVPIANAGNNIILTLPANATTLTGSGTDADGTIASYAWSRISGPATFTLGTANAATTTLTNLVQGTYTFRLTGTDNSGATDTDDMTVTVNAAPNQAPTANAGNNKLLTLPTNSGTLTGGGTDADGTITSYAWSRVSGPATFTIGTANAATTTLSNLVQGTYTFRLTVTDNRGAADTDDMTVTVNAAPNQAPTANAGNNLLLTLPTNFSTLTGGGTDADGTITSYVWSRVSGPATFSLGTANAATTTLTNLVQGTYIFRLTVTDNRGAADTDDMTVTVNAAPNQAPTANAGNNIILTLPTNSSTLTGGGTDADGTIVSYAWSRVSGPVTFTLGTANAATTTLSNLVQGTYTFRLTVTDNRGAADTDDMTVTVNAAPNQAPTANAGNNIILTLPTNSSTLTGGGTDADGTIVSYAWSRVSGPVTFTLGTANAATTTLSNLVQGTYTFRLTVTDNRGAADTDDMTVTVNAAPNQAPTANAGNNILLTLPTNSGTLTGSGTDTDGTIASYAWSRLGGPATFTLSTANAATTTLNNLVQGTYTFRLTVTDNSGATDTDDMTVTVNAAPVVNQVPIANAGNNIILTLPASATALTGTGTDADGTITSYAWSRVSGPATFTLGTANAATTTLSNLVQGTYTFRLTVTDNSGATDTDDMTVTINAAPVINQVPIANAGNNIVLTLPANVTTLTGTGTDADGTIASYAWSRVGGPATFTLGTANAATTTLSNLVLGTYTFRLAVTDNSGAVDTDDMTVTVNAAPVTNQAPLANAGNNIVRNLPANSTTLSGAGTDADGTIASYAWSRVSGPATFTLGTADAATTTLSNLVQGIYTFRLTVIDNSGGTDTDDMTVTLNAAPVVNQVPIANAGNNFILTLPTNATTLTGTGTDADGTIAGYAWSRMSGPATFTLGTADAATTTLNNLVQGTYTFRLTVTDNSGATDTDDMTVTVNAAPVTNQAPLANAGNNIILTLLSNATTLTGTGTDADGTIASYVWSRVSGPATFTLGTANAAATTLSNLVQGTYTFRLTVTDNDGATDTDDMTVTVNAAPVINQPPIANAGNNIILTLPANATTLTGSATDADGTIASFTWSGVSGPATFTLGTANAATTTLSNLVQGTYTFRLTVTDNSGGTDTDDMTVTVNAAPVINQLPVANAGNNIILTLPVNATTLTGSGTDADGTIASYAWSRVSGPATFTLGTADAATTTLSNLVQGTYTFRLTVTDNSGDTDTDDMTVTVNAAPVVNQVPIANAGNNIILTLPANATTLTGTGTDADGTMASYVWSSVSGPATFTLGTADAATTTLSNLVQGTYTFRLTVTDNDGATDTDDMTVTVNAAPVVNQPPVANAGNNIVLNLPANATTLNGTGTDADGTIATYAWSSVSGPATFILGTADAATTTLSDLVQGTYTFRLTVTDNSGATDTDDMTVTVNAAPIVNQPPVANAGNNIVLTLPTNATTLNGTGTDADGTIASYAWSSVSGPATFTLGTADAATTTLSDLVQGTYTFRLTVTDNDGATDTDDMTVTVNAAPVVNQPPVANAGNNIVLTLPATATTLTGTGTDADGTIASYAWSSVSGPATFTLGTADAATTTLSNLVQGTYTFRLTVTDNSGATDTDDMIVTVNAAPVTNQAPIANAGVSQVATLSSNEATLNGSLSRDPDGTIKSYKWEQISGPANAAIASISLVTTKVSSFREGDYVFQLTVTDNLNAIAKDTVTIAVVNNFRSFPGYMMLYPNPATDKITINLYNEKYGKAQITIYDITGRKVISTMEVNNSQARFTETIDIVRLKPGIYLIEVIMDNKEKVTAKFIKQ